MRKTSVLFALAASGSVVTDAGSTPAKVAIYLALSAIVAVELISRRRSYPNARGLLTRAIILASLICGASVAAGVGINFATASLLLKLLCAIAFALLVTENFEKFKASYIRAISALIILSIPLHLLAIAAPELLASVPTWMDEGKGFRTLVGLQYYPPSPAALRNASIFWEPGVFAFFINLAVIFQLTYRKLPSALMVVGLISTQSLGGFFILLIILAIKGLNTWLRRPGLAVMAALVLVGLSLPYVTNLASQLSEVVFSRDLVSDESFLARRVDLYYPFQVALDQPLTGFGLNNTDHYIGRAIDEQVTGQKIITNSWAIVAYSFGYVTLIGFVILFFTCSFTRSVGPTYLVPLALMFAHEPLLLGVFSLALCLAPNPRRLSGNAGAQGKFVKLRRQSPRQLSGWRVHEPRNTST